MPNSWPTPSPNWHAYPTPPTPDVGRAIGLLPASDIRHRSAPKLVAAVVGGDARQVSIRLVPNRLELNGHQPDRPFGIASPSVGGIDATGCDPWPYELVNAGVPHSFFTGSGFRAGVVAYEYGTQEVTALRGGRQLITVTNPTAQWLAAYRGFDVCTPPSTSGRNDHETCTAGAVAPRPDDWVWYIPVAVFLVVLIAFVAFNDRPAGPIRRRRRFVRHHLALSRAAANATGVSVSPRELRTLERRLRRLERIISSDLSESQHRWFHHHLSAGNPGMALEYLARWFVERRIASPDPLREEFEWLAESLNIRALVVPILDAREGIELPSLHGSGAPTTGTTTGFDVPLEDF